MDIHEILFFLAAVLFGFLWIWGVHCAMTMVFNKVANAIETWMIMKLPMNTRQVRNVLKPVFLCPPCMSSLHGLILFLVLFQGWPFYHVIAYVIVLAGLNYIIKEALYPE